MQHQPDNGALTASPASMKSVAPRPLGARSMLPGRNVTADTIEDAYVQFILYCNPAVPLESDTTALREAFRTPPKSGGKSFSTFTLFQLIAELESKELKTWAELALKLGVEPPDPDRGESSQKIQQYAVRLKRWMHSMHVDAFFEYLLDNPHPYWTQIPANLNPVSDTGRDGVAAEDDMALRALLPQIRPRRGRKRPEEEELHRSPSQRPRIGSPAMTDDFAPRGVEQLDLWSSQPDSRNNPFIFPPDPYARLNPNMAHPGMSWTNQDLSQTPLSAYPQSAMTPSTRHAFWSDPSEPRSAITPAKPRVTRRHGAKVVSSAWRSGGPGGTGKTRGRPPTSRVTNSDGPFSAFPAEGQVYRTGPFSSTEIPSNAGTQIPLESSANPGVAPRADMGISSDQETAEATTPQHPRPPRSRLSLQVPERVGAEVRLATPPPLLMVNGEVTPSHDSLGVEQAAPPLDLRSINVFTSGATNAFPGHMAPPADTGGPGPAGAFDQGQPPPATDPGRVQFRDPDDRTNRSELEILFIRALLGGEWKDGRGQPAAVPGVEEVQAVVAQVIENVMRKAASKETFLINVSALAGGSILRTAARVQCYRLDETGGQTRYLFSWELGLGDIRGTFCMRETVRHDRWRAGAGGGGGSEAEDSGGGGGAGEVQWQQKYLDVLEIMRRKDRELTELRKNVLDSLKAHSGREGSEEG